MSKLLACYGRDNLGTVLIEEGSHHFIIETTDDEGNCIAYRTYDNAADAIEEFNIQKKLTA